MSDGGIKCVTISRGLKVASRDNAICTRCYRHTLKVGIFGSSTAGIAIILGQRAEICLLNIT
jgi:hypothetical protein